MGECPLIYSPSDKKRGAERGKVVRGWLVLLMLSGDRGECNVTEVSMSMSMSMSTRDEKTETEEAMFVTVG